MAIIGESEIAEGVVAIKILNTNEQIKVPREEFVKTVKELTKKYPILEAKQ
jgi:histidyl-tRNA synthetase